MSRIVVAGMPASGHINPSVPVVGELVRRDIQVTYYATEQFRDTVERTGAEFRAYPEGTLSSEDIAEATRSGSSVAVVTRALAATDSLVPFLLADLRDKPPAAIAFDSNAIWGYMAAAMLGLPKISLMTTVMLGAKDIKVLTAREWAHFLRVMLPDVPSVIAARRRLLRRFGKQYYPPAPTLPMRGDVTIFPVPRELQSANARIDRSCHFVGPTFDPAVRGGGLDPELAAHVDGRDPLVLVSLGTLHAGSEAFFRTCFEVLGELPARVLLSVGTHTDPARLGPPPANTLARTSVPQLDVLRRAALFVTHGGMNSALEGLANGVPLVVLPQQVEQLVIGRAVADRGAGIVLRHNVSDRPVPPAELRAAVQRALADPTMRTAAKAMAARFGEGGGAAAAADVIQKLLADSR
ncbi:macrolide family glycosyltransferase [Allokutzneria oryzae]|uniref:Macrolide family glycosyltransferase n=1 Tax=Allokutzneria oryzae TaxID=1378989 RepID=A0ABV5ZXI8_9PSEU